MLRYIIFARDYHFCLFHRTKLNTSAAVAEIAQRKKCCARRRFIRVLGWIQRF